MTKTEFIPENYLLSLLAARLFGKQKPRPIPKMLVEKLPANLAYSERFLDLYRRNLRVALQKHIVAALQEQQFYFSIDGQTKIATVVDQLFWQRSRFSLSTFPADYLWQSALDFSRLANQQNQSASTPRFSRACTLWDSLFLLHLQPFLQSSFPPARFLPPQGDWLTLALRLTSLTPDELWAGSPCALLPDQRNADYPVRFLLIGWIANYLSHFQQRLAALTGPSRPVAAPPDATSLTRGDARQFQAALDEFRLHRRHLQNIAPTFSYWENSGAVGFDDAAFLGHAVSVTRLRETLAAVHDLLALVLGENERNETDESP